jgi:hypothetical protein
MDHRSPLSFVLAFGAEDAAHAIFLEQSVCHMPVNK